MPGDRIKENEAKLLNLFKTKEVTTDSIFSELELDKLDEIPDDIALLLVSRK